MGFVFTVLYIVLTIISPEQFGHEWASYHVLLYLAAVTALTSLPGILTQSHLRSSIQTYLLIGFIVAIGLSQVANKWFGGAIQSWLAFLPSAAVYFFIVANVTTVRRLKIVTMAVVATCLGLVVEALCGYYGGGVLGDTFVLKMNLYSSEQVVGQILRLRGVGFLSDPNDFAQVLLISLSLIFIAWRPGRILANSLFVLAPAGLLLWATYLTHSRGALVGLGVLGLMAARKQLGTAASVALASVLALGLFVLDFTGGRGISASEGADRLEAWATGLELFKHSPIFGIGFGNFTNFNYITAHNSVVLCLAELGLLGASMWLALLVATTMGLNGLIALREEPAIASGGRKEISDLPAGGDGAEAASDFTYDADRAASFEDQPVESGQEPPTDTDRGEVEWMDEKFASGNAEYDIQDASGETAPLVASWATTTEIAAVSEVTEPTELESVHEPIVPDNWLEIMRLALIAFMVTSWFLSRTYETPVYLVLGLATAAIALEPSSAETPDRRRWIPVTFTVEALAIVFIYLVVRFRR
jgi:putative inorganic carbon (HCO3(-)) transporter